MADSALLTQKTPQKIRKRLWGDWHAQPVATTVAFGRVAACTGEPRALRSTPHPTGAERVVLGVAPCPAQAAAAALTWVNPSGT